MPNDRFSGEVDVAAIIGRIKNEYRVGDGVTVGNATEFDFSAPVPQRGLVFEEVGTEENAPGDPQIFTFEVSEKNAPEEDATDDEDGFSFAQTQEAPTAFEAQESAADTSHDFFSASVSETSRGDFVIPENPAEFVSTYIPRFTEASEKYHRREGTVPEEQKWLGKSAAQAPSTIAHERVDATAEETEENVPEAVIVTTETKTAPPPAEHINIPKPKSTQPPEAERSLEDEKREISDLFTADAPTAGGGFFRAASVIGQKNAPASDENRSFFDFVPADLPAELGAIAPIDELIPPERTKHRTSEYTSLSQRLTIKDRFLDTVASVKVRFTVAGILALIVSFLENMFLFGTDAAAFLRLSMLPGAMAIVDLLFVVALFALISPELFVAVKALFKKQIAIGLLTVFFCIGIVAYDVTSIFAGLYDLPLFGGVFGLAALLFASSTYFSEEASFLSFKLISIEGAKRYLDIKKTVSLPAENFALDGAVDEYRSVTARSQRTYFITDFFKKIKAPSGDGKLFVTVTSVLFGVSAVLGVATGLLASSLAAGLTSFACAFVLGAPLFLLIFRAFPHYTAERAALSENGTVIGETSFAEAAQTDVVTFRDTEIFTKDDVAIKRMMIYGEKNKLGRVMRQMAALFSTAGGSLGEVFAASLDTHVPTATDIMTETDGVSAKVDGVTVYAGCAGYLLRHGISVPFEDRKDVDAASGTVRVMFAAEEKSLSAKFSIRYSFSENYTSLRPSLKEYKITTLIYTCDPNVDNDLIAALSGNEKSVRVMHVSNPTYDTEAPTAEHAAGVVTLSDHASAINLLLLSKRVVRLRHRLVTLAGICGACGFAVAIFLSAASATLHFASLFALLWQAVFLGIAVCETRLLLPVPKTKKDKK